MTDTVGADLLVGWGAFAPGRLARSLLWLSRSTVFGRGRLRRLIYRAFGHLHPGPVDTFVFNAPVRLHPANNVSERKALLRPDKMDPCERVELRRLMSCPHAIFVDVGANAGLYSLDAALHAGAGGQIIAIEPSEALQARLTFNLDLARRDGRIEPSVTVAQLAVAVGDHDGTALLAGDGSEGARGVLREGSARTSTTTSVQLRTLSGLISELGLPKIDILKIDVEGYEDKIWPPFLLTTPPAIWPKLLIIEHLARSTWSADCIAIAEANGYEIRFTTNNNTVLEKTG